MFEHLLTDDIYEPPVWEHMGAKPDYKVGDDVGTIIGAKYETAMFMERMGVEHVDPVAHETAAGAFNALLDPGVANSDKKAIIDSLRTPDAVKHLVGMLTAYEWDFVEQAKSIRSYITAALLEETKNHDPRIRLRAMEMLGKVTEVALFTERVQVQHVDMSDAQLEQAVRAKLDRLMTSGAVDVEATEVQDDAADSSDG